jgi:hypothetical protein
VKGGGTKLVIVGHWHSGGRIHLAPALEGRKEGGKGRKEEREGRNGGRVENEHR